MKKNKVNASTEALVPISQNPTASLLVAANPIVPFASYCAELPLDRIIPNPKNPRTEMADEGIKELAASIRQLNVESPILVMPLSDGRYQIVYGERRFRASQLAGKTTIPAKVEHMTPAQAEIRALHENIQRENMTPFDEGRAFEKLLKKRGMAITEICATFAKSKAYVENRMNLTKLIPQVATLLRNKDITLEVAQVFAKYDAKVQISTYEEHYKSVDAWCSWRGLSAKELDRRLFNTHLTKLNAYSFDKTQCKTCVSNTSNNVLFEECGDCAACRNPKCLQEKNTAYLIEHAIALATADPYLNLAYLKGEANKKVVAGLAQNGHEVKLLDTRIWMLTTPECPKTPDLSRIEDEDKRAKRQKKYETEVEKFKAERAKLDLEVISGLRIKYGLINDTSISISYEVVKQEKVGGRNNKTVESAPLSARDKVLQEDKRFYGVRYKNTVRDLKDCISDTKKKFEGKGVLSFQEQQAFHFILLNIVSSKSNMELLGMQEAYRDESKRLKYAGKITEKQKNMLYRMVIASYLQNIPIVHCTPENPGVRIMLDFMEMHVPKQYAAIDAKYKKTYESRHSTLMKRAEGLEKENELLRLKELEQTLQKQGYTLDKETGELCSLPAATVPPMLPKAISAADAIEEAEVVATVEAPALTLLSAKESLATEQSPALVVAATQEEPTTGEEEVTIPLTPAEVEPDFIELDQDEPLPDPVEIDPDFIEWEVENPFGLRLARHPDETERMPLAA